MAKPQPGPLEPGLSWEPWDKGPQAAAFGSQPAYSVGFYPFTDVIGTQWAVKTWLRSRLMMS